MPPREVIFNKIHSTDLLRPHYRRYFTFESNEKLNSAVTGLLSRLSLKANTSDGPKLPISLRVKTTAPDSVASVLQGLLKDVRTSERKSIKEKLLHRKKALKTQKSYLNKQWKQWLTEWKNIVGDTFPDLLQPRLTSYKSNYQSAAKQLSKVRRKQEMTSAKLKEIKRLLKNEPPHFGYKLSPYFLLTLQGNSSNLSAEQLENIQKAPSNILNTAYLQLRKKRVDLVPKVSSLAVKKNQLKNRINKMDTLVTLIRKFPALKEQKSSLKRKQKYFRKKINQVESNLSTVNYLLSSLPAFYEIYPPELPGKRIPTKDNSRRNTLLAGAVSFLLLLFGTAFWEII